jgi:vancomycin resistance protein YoaR
LGDGGGVCQVSTTLFRAALNAGLPILERQAHAYRVSYYEQESFAGLDATVYSPKPDLKIQNDTPAHILIQARVFPQEFKLVFQLYGTADGRRATITNPRLWDQVAPPPPLYIDDPTLPKGEVRQVESPVWGAKAAFDWKVVRDGQILQERTFYSVYQPWQAVYLRGTKE